ncbi:hypothetical protein [Vagococcus xieshaowenii]|uniref:Lipoprotein n=1 Tax=Vagococcus xieshaowenii TaxID=2562451 RepID=A0ABX5TBM7_9ENTE|nr:hypothetical protein [Vagococcus xieshaowenii]QCA28154.1 hypothetical protein E4Z98_02065 [Vagococcus xieshaowenii]
MKKYIKKYSFILFLTTIFLVACKRPNQDGYTYSRGELDAYTSISIMPIILIILLTIIYMFYKNKKK